MNILFIHGNYPAQFRSLVSDLGRQQAHDVRFLTARKDPDKFPINGANVVRYEDPKKTQILTSSRTQSIANEQIQRGEIVQEAIQKLINDGFTPRLVIFHGGNGIGLFIRQILPKAVLIGYFEWFFTERCAQLILGNNNINTLNYIQSRNISSIAEMTICDGCVVPTDWQASQFPPKLRKNLTTIFDGIDTGFFHPGSPELFTRTIKLQGEDDSMLIEQQDLLLTYATRGMEPLRGFPEFMKTLPTLLCEFPNLKVLIGGRDRSAYGPPCSSHNGSWKEMMLDKLPMLKKHPQIIYTGLMNYENYRLMLQRTNLHCYLTHPYVTSWSLFEAVACGAPVITNRSEATNETIPIEDSFLIDRVSDVHGKNGIEKIKSILSDSPKNHSRKSSLPSSFSLNNAKNNWQNFINQMLSQAA